MKKASTALTIMFLLALAVYSPGTLTTLVIALVGLGLFDKLSEKNQYRIGGVLVAFLVTMGGITYWKYKNTDPAELAKNQSIKNSFHSVQWPVFGFPGIALAFNQNKELVDIYNKHK